MVKLLTSWYRKSRASLILDAKRIRLRPLAFDVFFNFKVRYGFVLPFFSPPACLVKSSAQTHRNQKTYVHQPQCESSLARPTFVNCRAVGNKTNIRTKTLFPTMSDFIFTRR